ncbi:MAG: 5'/3'-nucleotidase SurE [Pseudomonadota bacterium]
MRILVTNDDGINAPGLTVLERIATEIAGPGGEVFTVAPAFEQSGVGHCINYSRPTMLAELGPHRYAAEGSPADCVMAGIYVVMENAPPDLVLSGINRGNNAAEAVLYSGTVGGAMEAALQGIPAIALSQFFGPRNRDLADPFEAGGAHGVSTIRALLDNGVWDEAGYRVFYNVNFPPVPAGEVKGLRTAAQGCRNVPIHGVAPQTSPTGRTFLWVQGISPHRPTEPGTDVAVNLEDYTSVTPLRADLTAHDLLSDLKARLG